MQTVVEFNLTVLDAVVKVNVFGKASKVVCDIGQSKIMRSDETNGATANQAGHNGRSANPPVMRVGTAQQFIEKKQDWLEAVLKLNYFSKP